MRLAQPVLTLMVMLTVIAIVACHRPPGPSPATIALKSSLLTPAEIGNAFEQEFRGEVGVSGGDICPNSDFRFDDVGMVRVSFVSSPDGNEQIEFVEQLYVVETGILEDLMVELESAYELCYGEVWTDYGQTQTVESMSAPEIGDRILAIRWFGGDSPFTGRVDATRTVYVSSGDIFIEFSVSEAINGRASSLSLSDESLFGIVGRAVAKLPN